MDGDPLIGDYSLTGVVLWALFLGLMVFVIRRCIGYRRLNTFTIFLPFLLLTSGFLLPFSRNLNAVLSHHAISDLAFRRFWIATALMYLCLPVGILAANLFRRRERPNHVFLSTPQNSTGCYLYAAGVALIAALSIAQIYHDGLQLDLTAFFTGFVSPEAYADHRYSFAAATSGFGYFIYNKLPYSIAPLAVIIVANWKRLAIVIKVLFMGVLAFALMQTGHKLPLVMIFGVILVGRYAIKGKMMLTWKFRSILGVFSGLLVFVILPLFYIAQGEPRYGDALFWSIERLCGESYRALQLAFEVYPEHHPFLYGTSQQTIAALAGVHDFVSVSIYIPREFLGQPNTSYPGLFIEEAWADYGYFGVVAYSIICGFILQFYNVIYYNRSVHYLEDSALLIVIMINSVYLGNSNLITTCFSYGLLVSGIIYLMIKSGRQKSQRRIGRTGLSPVPES